MLWKETCAMQERRAFIDAWLSQVFASPTHRDAATSTLRVQSAAPYKTVSLDTAYAGMTPNSWSVYCLLSHRPVVPQRSCPFISRGSVPSEARPNRGHGFPCPPSRE